MKIGVTGSEGKVGRHLVRHLMEQGYEVRAISMQPWEEAPTENVAADITDYDQLYRAFEGCGAIIHLAGIPHPIPDQDTLVYRTNTLGVFNAALAAGNLGIGKLVIASSDCALGITFSHQNTRPVYLPLDEAHPTAPDNCYGLSKAVGEQIADAMAKRFGTAIISLRISAFMTEDTYKSDWFQRDLTTPERGVRDNLWTYIDSRDCVRAFRLALESPIEGHEVIHIAAADTRAAVPTAELVSRYFPELPLKKTFQDFDCLHDLSKAKRLIGFVPEHSWRETK